MLTGVQEPFKFLLERVPLWLKTLQLLSAGFASQKSDHTSADSDQQQPPPLTDGTSHSGVSDDHALTHHETNQLSLLYPEPVHIVKKRKRQTESGGSRRNKYRGRNATVLLYNGDAQRALVILVDDISKATGLIRLAKLARSRLPTKSPSVTSLVFTFSGPGNEADDDEDQVDHDLILEQVRKRRRGTSEITNRSTRCTMKKPELIVTPRAAIDQNDTTLLDTTVKALEAVSDLCEMAAYQLLRDGNCRIEARAATSKLEEIHAPLVREAAVLQESRRHAVPTIVESDGTTEQARSPPPAIKTSVTAAVDPSMDKTNISDDEEDEEILLSPIRLTSRQGLL